MDSLRDMVALVTGASGGIGPHIARALAAEGAHLAVVARSAAALEALAGSLRQQGVRVAALPADLTREADRAALLDRVEAALGPVDVLVNNAGVESVGPFATLAPEVVAATVELNLTAPLLLARAALPGMLARRRGHLVNVASIAGKKGVPYEAVYCATKAGLVEWTAAVRAELAGSGVSASAICPGLVTGEGMFARFGVPAPRTTGSCTPAEVARAVVESIRGDLPEVIVNSLPLRALLAVNTLSPRAGAFLLRALGVNEFQRRKVGAP
jgi:short-subunit dehydrogenase